MREKLRHITPEKVEKTLQIRYRTDTNYEGTVFVPEKELAGKSEKEKEKTILQIIAEDARTAAGLIGKEYTI